MYIEPSENIVHTKIAVTPTEILVTVTFTNTSSSFGPFVQLLQVFDDAVSNDTMCGNGTQIKIVKTQNTIVDAHFYNIDKGNYTLALWALDRNGTSIPNEDKPLLYPNQIESINTIGSGK